VFINCRETKVHQVFVHWRQAVASGVHKMETHITPVVRQLCTQEVFIHWRHTAPGVHKLDTHEVVTG
jgi:hypothetical protein